MLTISTSNINENILQKIATGEIIPSLLYVEKQPISTAKHKDLTGMLHDGIIPKYYSSFYNSITASKHVKDPCAYTTPKGEGDADADYDFVEVEMDIRCYRSQVH